MATQLLFIVFTLIAGRIIHNAFSDAFMDLAFNKLNENLSFNSVSKFYFDNFFPAVLTVSMAFNLGFELIENMPYYSFYYLTFKVIISVILIGTAYKLPMITKYLVGKYDHWGF